MVYHLHGIQDDDHLTVDPKYDHDWIGRCENKWKKIKRHADLKIDDIKGMFLNIINLVALPDPDDNRRDDE